MVAALLFCYCTQAKAHKVFNIFFKFILVSLSILMADVLLIVQIVLLFGK